MNEELIKEIYAAINFDLGGDYASMPASVVDTLTKCKTAIQSQPHVGDAALYEMNCSLNKELETLVEDWLPYLKELRNSMPDKIGEISCYRKLKITEQIQRAEIGYSVQITSPPEKIQSEVVERVARAIKDLNVIADSYCYEIAHAAIAAMPTQGCNCKGSK